MAGEENLPRATRSCTGEDGRDRYGSAQSTTLQRTPRASRTFGGTPNHCLQRRSRSAGRGIPDLSADDAFLARRIPDPSIDMNSSRLARTLASIAAGALVVAALTAPAGAQGQPNTGTGPA